MFSLGGIGMGMIFLPAIVSVGYYFTSKRAFATGIAVCGSGVGAFLFAPFCQFLLSVTTWQNTLLILGFLMLCCSFFGALIKPLNIHAEAVLEEDLDTEQIQDNEYRKPLLQRIAEEKRRRLLAHSNSQFLLMMQNGSVDIHDPTFNELKERLTMNTEPGVHSTLYLDQLFNPSPAPTPTPTAHQSSANGSQLHIVPEKHQLSPILEKKVLNMSSNENSTENSAEELNSNSTMQQAKGEVSANEDETVDSDNEEDTDEVDQKASSNVTASPKSELTVPTTPDKSKSTVVLGKPDYNPFV